MRLRIIMHFFTMFLGLFMISSAISMIETHIFGSYFMMVGGFLTSSIGLFLIAIEWKGGRKYE